MGRYPIAAENIASLRKADTGFIAAVILMCGLGFTTLYSTSGDYALRAFGDTLYFVKRQGLFLLIGFTCMTALVFINLESLRRFLPFMVVVPATVSAPFAPTVKTLVPIMVKPPD